MYKKMGFVVALIALAADLATKWMVLGIIMQPPKVIQISSFFSLNLGFNRGISFGLLSSPHFATPYLLSTFALIVVLFLVTQLWRGTSKIEAIGIGAIVGGATANVIDRLVDGTVTDFLDFQIYSYHWPTFNVPDTAIFSGVVLFIVASIFDNKRSSGQTEPAEN
tara:strand:+ start:1615 stop:2109 length:495 start_codon:yes stop_codon:yes gene_type:complete